MTEMTARTQAELEQVWRTLMGPLGFRTTSLWLVLIGADDRPVPPVIKIDDPPEQLDESDAALLVSVLPRVEGSRWAFLRTRPGYGGPTLLDRLWISLLLDACRAAGMDHDVAHVASGDTLAPVPLDDQVKRAG